MKWKIIILAIFMAGFFAGAFSTMVESSTIVNSPKVSVTLLSQDPDPVEPGKYVDLRWKVENYGGEETDDFIFMLEPEFPFSLDPGISAEQRLGRLDSYQIGDDAYIIYYRVRVSSDAVIGTNKIKYKYSINNGVSWLETKDDVRVDESNPMIRIDNVNINPNKVKPGESLSIELNIENIAPKIIKNVQASLSFTYNNEEIPFSPIGTNAKVIKEIEPNENKLISFSLICDSDSSLGTYKIPLTISFEDEDGNSYTRSYYIGIQVYDKPEYLLNLESSDIYKTEQKGRVVISISNNGITKIKFLSVKMMPSNDYDIISPDSVYIGNLDSDDFETTEFEIYSHSKKDTMPMQFKISYKDEFNRDYEEVGTLTIPLYNKEESIKLGLEKKEDKSKLIIGLLLGIPLVIFWLFMLIEALRSEMEIYRKILWVIMILTTFVVGAILYYMIGRKTEG